MCRMNKCCLMLILLGLCVSCSNARRMETFGYGLVFDEAQYNAVPLRAMQASRAYENLPTAVSLQSYAPLAGNQKHYGTCSVWSTVYGARTMLESIALDRTDRTLSTQNAFSPLFVYKQLSSDASCTEGLWLGAVCNFLLTTGAPKMLTAETTADFADFSLERYADSALYPIGDYCRLFDKTYSDQQKIAVLKKSIAEKHPVVLGMKVFDTLRESKRLWSAAHNGLSQTIGNHAMLVVAYDDQKYGGAFELMNSWGTHWAQSGCVWIPYTDIAAYSFEAYELTENRWLYANTIRFSASITLPVWAQEETMPVSYISDGCYQVKKAYPSGTAFQIHIHNQEPAYVYAFASDKKTQKTTAVFPYTHTIFPLLDYGENSIVYPSENSAVQLDATTGTDYLIVLFSKTKLDLNAIRTIYEHTTGQVTDRILTALGYTTVQVLSSNFSRNAIQFSVEASNKNAVVWLLVAIEHTEE